MTLIVHLSDLHIDSAASSQELVFDKLVATLKRERQTVHPDRVAVFVTGDVFDSGTDPSAPLVKAFVRLHARIVDALGGDAPTVVVPGNHDRRRVGMLGPHREELFHALRAAVDPQRIYVAGCRTPFLAQVVPPEMHGLDAHVIAYDSSYLPRGLVGAGGTIRLEDLLQAHAQLPDDGKPVVVLVHHHIIPTPITDVSPIHHAGYAGGSRAARWFVGTALPALVSHADREELTMTALGAGTALSTLHSFGRAVLLLHGHKHVPTARLVRGMTIGCGDVLIASAGSAGRHERVHATVHPDAARLWPSFNLIDLTDDRVRIESLSFSPKHTERPPNRRDLARSRRTGARWDADPIPAIADHAAQRMELDESRFALTRSQTSAHRWDFACERRVRLAEGATLRRYVDFVHALPSLAPTSRAIRRPGRRIELAIGDLTSYRIADGLCRTIDEGARAYGLGTAFEWVGLLCRYGAARAVLRLDRAHAEDLQPFGSITDLTTGSERPVALSAAQNHWTMTCAPCPARSLLRIYWPLAAR